MSMIPWWREPNRHDFNRIADNIDLEGEVTGALSVQVRKLYQLDQAQERDIDRLETIIKVLSQLLIEAGVLDPQQISQRVGAALAVQARQEVQERTNPQLRCARCQETVAQKDTYMTGLGAVCDSCYRALEA
jgi:formylmethanofuran dehydrogenase subunit E